MISTVYLDFLVRREFVKKRILPNAKTIMRAPEISIAKEILIFLKEYVRAWWEVVRTVQSVANPDLLAI
jgi:hypothetical protein